MPEINIYLNMYNISIYGNYFIVTILKLKLSKLPHCGKKFTQV